MTGQDEFRSINRMLTNVSETITTNVMPEGIGDQRESDSRANMLERFKCAGVMLLRGVAATVVLPIKFGFGLAEEIFDSPLGFMVNVSDDGELALGAATFGAACGLVAGVAVLANTLVEAPYQLVRSGKPQSKPFLLRASSGS